MRRYCIAIYYKILNTFQIRVQQLVLDSGAIARGSRGGDEASGDLEDCSCALEDSYDRS